MCPALSAPSSPSTLQAVHLKDLWYGTKYSKRTVAIKGSESSGWPKGPAARPRERSMGVSCPIHTLESQTTIHSSPQADHLKNSWSTERFSSKRIDILNP